MEQYFAALRQGGGREGGSGRTSTLDIYIIPLLSKKYILFMLFTKLNVWAKILLISWAGISSVRGPYSIQTCPMPSPQRINPLIKT